MSKRTVLISAGAVLTAAGGAVAVGGAVLTAVVGTDGTVSTGRQAFSTTTTALVSERGDLGGPGSDSFGDSTLKVSASGSDEPVFVGIGRSEDVDRYLAGAATETVTDVDVLPFQLDPEKRQGAAQAGSPLDETFWVAQSDGATSAATTWKIQDGSYRVVVMNADGSAGLDVDGTVSVHVPVLGAVAVTVLAGGALLVVIGVPLLVTGLRTRTSPTPQAPVAQELTTVG